MKRPIPHLIMVCGSVLLLLLTATQQGVCNTGTETAILPCIPDIRLAQQALAQRRGARFIAFLQKTGDRYIRNGDYDCLYDLLARFDENFLTIRESRYLLLYRIIAQMGQERFVHAQLDYDWLFDTLGLGRDPDFDRLMESQLDTFCAPAVSRFTQTVQQLHNTHNREHSKEMQPETGEMAAFLHDFAVGRLTVWDFQTLKRCVDSIDARRFSPAEQLILQSIRLTVNINLNRTAEAYRAWMQYRDLWEVFPWAAGAPESLETAFSGTCAAGLGGCGAGGLFTFAGDDAATQVFTAISHLETDAIGGNRCNAGWVCVKAALERMLAPKGFFKSISKERLQECFYLAKANMMVEDYQLAHRQLMALKVSAGIVGSTYSSRVDQMVETCATRLRQSRKPSLVEKLSGLFDIFYHTARDRVILVLFLASLLALFFIRWNASFKQGQPTLASFFTALEKIPPQLSSVSLPRFTFKWLWFLKRLFEWPRSPHPPFRWLRSLQHYYIRLRSRCKWGYRYFRIDLRSFHRILRKLRTELKERLESSKLLSCEVFPSKNERLDDSEAIRALPDDYPGIDAGIRNRSRDMAAALSAHAPYPICLIARIPGYRPRRYLLYYMGVGAGLSLLSTWVFSYGNPGPFRDHAIFFFLLTTTLLAALTGIRIMTRKALHSIDEIATMLGKGDTLEILRRQILIMFRSPWQFFVAFVLYGLFFIVSKSQLPSTHAVVILIILIVSPIHWMMISSLFLTRELCTLEDLSINPLSPLKTWGLQKWIAVIGTFATTGSIIITFSATIPVLMRLQQLSGRDLFWLFAMLPLLLAYWIYPYFKIRNMVREFKLQRMHFIKAHISRAYDNWQTLAGRGLGASDPEGLVEIEHQMDRLKRYHDLFKVIDQSPEFFVDIYSILELAKVMGIPSLFALVAYLLRML